MKALLVIALGLVSFAGAANAANRTTCAYRTAAADIYVFETKVRVQIGEATLTDLAQAQLNAQEVKFECRAILFTEYCATAPTLANQVAEGLKAEARTGQRSQAEYSKAMDKAFEISGLCQ